MWPEDSDIRIWCIIYELEMKVEEDFYSDKEGIVGQRIGKERHRTPVRQIKEGDIVLPSRVWETIVA